MTFLINYFRFASCYFSPSTTSESSIADLIKAAISDFSNDIPSNVSEADDADDDVNEIKTTTKATVPETTSARTRSDNADKKNKRRGVWKRVRVRPIDGFETAESQNIGKQIYNTILSDSAKESFEKGVKTNSYQSYEISDENNGFVSEKNEDATVVPSPGDLDLGTGAPLDLLANGTYKDSTTTEKTETISTQAPEVTTFENDDDFETDVTVAPTEMELKVKEVLSSLPPAVNKPSERNSQKEHQTEISVAVEEDPKWTESPESDSQESDDDVTTVDANNNNSDDEDNSNSNDEEREEPAIPDQDPQSSLYMDEVRQKLSSLFSFPDEPVPTKELTINKNFKRARGPSYTTIERNRAASAAGNELETDSKAEIKPSPMKLHPISVEKTILHPVTESSFHKDLMDSVVYATSTSTEVSHETEICYRGRCVKSIRKP